MANCARMFCKQRRQNAEYKPPPDDYVVDDDDDPFARVLLPYKSANIFWHTNDDTVRFQVVSRISREVCVCGKRFLDNAHGTEIEPIQGRVSAPAKAIRNCWNNCNPVSFVDRDGWLAGLVGFCVGFPYKSTYMHMVCQRAEAHKYTEYGV